MDNTKEPMNDFMVDLETVGVQINSAILTIAIVQCDLITGKTGAEFTTSIDFDTLQEEGFEFSGSTFYWWLQQSKFAREGITEPTKTAIKEAFKELNEYFEYLGNPGNFRLWGNGKDFDCAMLRTAYHKVNTEFPIPFWQDRDVRTVIGFSPKRVLEDWRRKNPRKGIHNALADAKYQIEYCSYILQILGCKELY